MSPAGPEEQARRRIDALLQAAGWAVQDASAANIHAARGVAIREFPLKTGHGYADYLLYIDGKAAWSEDEPDGRWRAYDYEALVVRDKASLDIFWLKDESLSDAEDLPPPEVIAQEIVEDLEAALEQFREIALDLDSA